MGSIFPSQPPFACDSTILQKLMALPSIAQVIASPHSSQGSEVQVVLAIKDVANNGVVKLSRNVSIANGSSVVGQPMPMAAYSSVSVSPSGNKIVMVKPGKEQETIMEVWEGAFKLAELVVPATTHGAIYNDSFFGHGIRWSPCEKHIAYVAERSAKDGKAAAPSDGEVEVKSSKDTPASLKIAIKTDSKKKDDWGELNTKKNDPKVYTLDVNMFAISEVPGQKHDHTYGQPTWTPDGGIMVVCWPHTNYLFPNLSIRLGSVYCFNRPCHLLHWPSVIADGKPNDQAVLQRVVLQPSLDSAMEPRFTPDGDLIFISHQQACEQGTHHASGVLHKAAWTKPVSESKPENPSIEVSHSQVTQLVESPASGEFPGLYSTNLSASLLPEHPFLDKETVILNTQWGVCSTIVKVSLSSGAVTRLTPSTASYSAVCSDGNRLFAVKGCLHELPSLMMVPLASLLSADNAANDIWEDIEGVLGIKDQAVLDLLGSITTEVTSTHRPESSGLKAIDMESLVHSVPSVHGSGKGRTALFLHGGPHSAVGHAFLPPLLFLLSEGYRVVVPNYRGSSGYGEAHLQVQPGLAGRVDVDDCKSVIDDLIERGQVDGSQVAVVGGSHGGFLTGHLLGQYPGVFTCGVMRNPVLDVRLMVHMSDIPDWCFIQALGSGKSSREQAVLPLTGTTAAALHAISPIKHVHNVTEPVLMFLGAKDRRVPMADGIAYSNALRCMGKPVKIHMFEEDTHSLDKPLTSYDQWLNIAEFFNMHTKAD